MDLQVVPVLESWSVHQAVAVWLNVGEVVAVVAPDPTVLAG